MSSLHRVNGVRRLFGCLAAVVLVFSGALSQAQSYTSIVVFGDSLSDTGNDAVLSYNKYGAALEVPSPITGYTNGRFTDGLDTSPAARLYTGIYVEQLAAMLAAKPAVTASLSGGTDYAYGYADTGSGTNALTYGPSNVFSITVNNLATQVASYLATRPTITNKTLFVVWGGANDLLAATATNGTQIVQTAVTNQLALLQTLISAGATDFLVVNLPPLGLIPRLNGTPATATAASALAAAFNSGLAQGIAALPAANAGKTLNLRTLDVYTLFNTVIGPPLYPGFANVTAESQYASVNPDTYLFWDDLHPTTYGHHIIATQALTAIGTPVTTTTVLTASNSNVNSGTMVTFTASVTAGSGTTAPVGTVTFFNGTNVLGTGIVTGSTATGTATFSTSTLAAGSQTISATFTGVNGYVNSTSSSIQEIVTAPGFSAAPAGTVTIASGQTGTATLNLLPVGGFAGTVTLACGATQPAHFTCAISPTSVTYPGGATTATVTIATNAMAELRMPFSGKNGTVYAVLILLPGVWAGRRKLGRRGVMMGAAFCVAMGAVGCGSSNNNAPAGTYMVPVTYTVSGNASTVNITVVVQ